MIFITMNSMICRIKSYGIKITLLVFLFSTTHAYAFICQNIKTGAQMYNGTSSVSVPLSRNMTVGQVVYFDLSTSFQCKNEVPSTYSDYMYIQSDGYNSSLPSAFETGVRINGVDYQNPVPYTIVLNLPKGSDSSFHTLNLAGYYKLGENPGESAHIHAGDVLATIQLYKYAYAGSSTVKDGEKYFTWTVLAANDSFLTSGSCDINGGQALEVNFGSLKASDISSTIKNDLTKKVHFTYKCKNPINTSIKMTLSADTTSFSDKAILLSNEDLGVVMSYKGNNISPYEGYNTTLSLGQGSDDISFSLIKKENSSLTPGEFSGSATLVMSSD